MSKSSAHGSNAASLATRAALLVGVVAIVYLIWFTGGSQYQVHVEFDDALNIVDGALVQAAGVNVGTVASSRYVDGHAELTLNIDKSIAPLRRGTSAEIRLASVSGNVNRRIELTLGPQDALPIPDGGSIAATSPGPVELDDVLQAFNPATRANLADGLSNVARSLSGHTGALNYGVHELGPGMNAIGGVISDLNESQHQLSTLLSDGDAVTGVLAAHQGQLSATVTLASDTFTTFADHSRQLQDTLAAMPSTFRQVDQTTTRLQPTLSLVTELLRELAPGAAQLRPLAAVATPTLAALRSTATVGVNVVRNLTSSAPEITKLLSSGTPFVQKLTPAVTEATPMVNCLRPYTPEIAGTISNWDSWTKSYDATSHIGKIFVDAGPGSVFDEPKLSLSTLQKLGFGYAEVRPPGYIGGKPEFMPECDYTEAGLNPADDWDNR